MEAYSLRQQACRHHLGLDAQFQSQWSLPPFEYDHGPLRKSG
ncbi:hypothetical protein HMPREF0970_01877 [Schaalia odontolytica F0309]|uniref:Uncharacterized protein n=1 Tax=Schaalia odontolytica F0309 TaxID=649742 RepID=D4U0Y3_9ACTO|nr:hypothetical protein HMPREF0970_01877 [Schaalia odontolytica F0309]